MKCILGGTVMLSEGFDQKQTTMANAYAKSENLSTFTLLWLSLGYALWIANICQMSSAYVY